MIGVLVVIAAAMIGVAVYMMVTESTADPEPREPEPDAQVANAQTLEDCKQIEQYPYKANCVLGAARAQEDPGVCSNLLDEKVGETPNGRLLYGIPSTGVQEVSPRNYCLARYARTTFDSRACSLVKGNDDLKQFCNERYGDDR